MSLPLFTSWSKAAHWRLKFRGGSHAVWLVGCQSQYHDNKPIQLVIEVKLRN